MLARIEGLASHLEERIQGTALSCSSLAILAGVRAVLLRRFSLELLMLLLLRLLERRVMQTGMNGRVMKRGVMMVMMGERVRATGIRHGAPSGRRGAAEGRLANGAGHGCEWHTHQREVPRSGRVTRMTTVMMMVVQMVLMLLKVMTVLTEAGIRRVPGTDNLRFWPMRQDVEDTEGLDPAIVGLPFSLVLLIRVLHLHHFQTFQRLEIIVSRAGGCRTIAACPAVYLFFFLIIFLVVSERCNRIAALTSSATGSSIWHPVFSVTRVISLFILRHRISRVGSSGTQPVGVILPGGGQLVFRVWRHDH